MKRIFDCSWKLLLVIFMIMLPAGIDAQCVQNGIVKEYKEKAKKSPVPAVEVKVKTAGTTISEKDGTFSLSFPTLKPGERIKVKSISKPGYEIFNKEAIEQWNLNPNIPFEIVLCRSDKFKKIRDNYYKVASENYGRQLKKEEAALASLKAEGKIRQEEYQRRLDTIRDEYERRLDKLEVYVDRFSRIDLSEISEKEQEIIALVQRGDFDAAVDAYEQLDVIGRYESEKKQLGEIADATRRLDEVSRMKVRTCEDLKKAVRRQVDVLKLSGGKENLHRVGVLLRQLADADTTDAAAAMDFAYFASSQKYDALYRIYLQRAIRHGDASQRFIAGLDLDINKTLSFPSDSISIANLTDALDSEYCRENPFLRISYIAAILNGNSNARTVSDEVLSGYTKEIDEFMPHGYSEWMAKVFAQTMKVRFMKDAGWYSDPSVYEADLAELCRLAVEYKDLSGSDNSVMFLSLMNFYEYMSLLLGRGDIASFDTLMSVIDGDVERMFLKDPVQLIEVYRLFNILKLSREIYSSGGERINDMYTSFLRNVRESGVLNEALMALLLTDCSGVVVECMKNGVSASHFPYHSFFAEFPPEGYGIDFIREMVGILVVVTVGVEDKGFLTQIESVLDGYLEVTPALKMPRLAKGEIRLAFGDEAGAKKQLDILISLNPDQDYSNTNLFKRLSTQ